MRTRQLLFGIGFLLLTLSITPDAFAACDMSGIWVDNFGYKWYVGQANNNAIQGSVITFESRNWRLSGNIDVNDNQFTLQAQCPDGPVEPTSICLNFEYYSTSNNCSTASGNWANDPRAGGSGTFSMSKTAAVPEATPVEPVRGAPGVSPIAESRSGIDETPLLSRNLTPLDGVRLSSRGLRYVWQDAARLSQDLVDPDNRVPSRDRQRRLGKMK